MLGKDKIKPLSSFLLQETKIHKFKINLNAIRN